MKNLIVLLALLIMVGNAQANSGKHNCDAQVEKSWEEHTEDRGYQYEGFYGLDAILSPGDSYERYGEEVYNDYGRMVLVYVGASSYYSGYGEDAIVVDPLNCSILDMINLYAE